MNELAEALLRHYFARTDASDLVDCFERLDDDSVAGVILDDFMGPLVRAAWKMRDEVAFEERRLAGFPSCDDNRLAA